MALRLPPHGFWSYARKDDTYSDRRVSELCDRIRKEVSLNLGYEATIFQDTSAITSGAEWKEMIERNIAAAAFLVPVVTPTFIQRPWCWREVSLFLEREKALRAEHPELRHQSLVFPIGYREVDDEDAIEPALMKVLQSRQWIRLEGMRDRDLKNPALVEEVRRIGSDIARLLKIRLRAQEEREARRAAEALERVRRVREKEESEAKDRLAAELREKDRHAREEEERFAAEQRERDVAAAAQAAPEAVQATKPPVGAQAQPQKGDGEAETASRRQPRPSSVRTRRPHFSKAAEYWTRPAVALMLVLVALVVIVFALRPSDDAGSGKVEAGTAGGGNDAAPGPVAAKAVPVPVPVPVPKWLYRRWGVNGRCDSVMKIDGNGAGFRVDVGASGYDRTIVAVGTNWVTTSAGTYSLQLDGSLRSTEPELEGLKLTDCTIATGM